MRHAGRDVFIPAVFPSSVEISNTSVTISEGGAKCIAGPAGHNCR